MYDTVVPEGAGILARRASLIFCDWGAARTRGVGEHTFHSVHTFHLSRERRTRRNQEVLASGAENWWRLRYRGMQGHRGEQSGPSRVRPGYGRAGFRDREYGDPACCSRQFCALRLHGSHISASNIVSKCGQVPVQCRLPSGTRASYKVGTSSTVLPLQRRSALCKRPRGRSSRAILIPERHLLLRGICTQAGSPLWTVRYLSEGRAVLESPTVQGAVGAGLSISYGPSSSSTTVLIVPTLLVGS
jgi:hypothetical protein